MNVRDLLAALRPLAYADGYECPISIGYDHAAAADGSSDRGSVNTVQVVGDQRAVVLYESRGPMPKSLDGHRAWVVSGPAACHVSDVVHRLQAIADAGDGDLPVFLGYGFQGAGVLPCHRDAIGTVEVLDDSDEHEVLLEGARKTTP